MDIKWKELKEEVDRIIQSRCIGCVHDDLSKKYHNYCLLYCSNEFYEIVKIATKNIIKWKQLRAEADRIIRSRCLGCIHNRPSQNDHKYCLLDCNQDFEEIEHLAKTNINYGPSSSYQASFGEQHKI